MFCLILLVHMLCGSCTGGMCHFSCGVNVVIVTNFVRKGIMAYWRLMLSAWNPFRGRPIFHETFTCCLFTKIGLTRSGLCVHRLHQAITDSTYSIFTISLIIFCDKIKQLLHSNLYIVPSGHDKPTLRFKDF